MDTGRGTPARTAIDLLAWTQTAQIDDMPALVLAEPYTLRYRVLHTAARIVTGGRRLRAALGPPLVQGSQTRPGLHPTPPDPAPT